LTPSTAEPPPACASDDHRAFDFWIGSCEVTAAGQDQTSATNSISREHDGCVLREEYSTRGGYTGMSLSFYDASRKRGHEVR